MKKRSVSKPAKKKGCPLCLDDIINPDELTKGVVLLFFIFGILVGCAAIFSAMTNAMGY